MRSIMVWALFGVSSIGNLVPSAAVAQETEEGTKVCENFVLDPGGPAYKAFCWLDPEERHAAARIEAFDDGVLQVDVHPNYCRDTTEIMHCNVSGNLLDWSTFFESEDSQFEFYEGRVPLLTVACFCTNRFWRPRGDDF